MLLIFFAVLALLAGMAFYSSQHGKQSELPELQTVTLLPKAKPLIDSSFVDHMDQPFDKSNFRNKWSLVFFGFTNCPDICPTTLHTLKQIKQSAQNDIAWDNYQVIFMSVDPKRDTVERLSKYVPFFDASFIGTTGDEQSTLEFTKSLGIIYAYHEQDEAGNYNVDHSASILLINPKAELAGIISAPHNAENIAKDLVKLGSSDYSKKLLSLSSKQQTENLDEKKIIISDAWVRAAPPGVSAMAAYMTIQNNSNSDITISQVSSPLFNMSMLHETTIENGMASMQHSEGILVKANKSAKLEPQGHHVMLMNPQQDFSVGDKINITLITYSGISLEVTAEVKTE